MTDWEVLNKYIGEHGQKYGTVSWQMARDSLKAPRYKHENEKIRPIMAQVNIEGKVCHRILE